MAGLQNLASDTRWRRTRRLTAGTRLDRPWGSEVGSELEFDEKSIFEPVRCSWDQLIPHRARSLTLLHSGRAAIRSALRAIASAHSEPLSFLLPSYLCPAVVQPFQDLGVNYSFYPISNDLRTDWDEVRHFVDSGRYTGLLFIRYFGSTAYDAPPARLAPKGKTFYIIEDLAQAMLSPGAGGRGDYVTYSLRKIFGLPDGGAVVARDSSPLPTAAEYPDAFFGLRMRAFRLRHLYRSERLGTRETYLEAFRRAEASLDASSVDAPMSWFSQSLLMRNDPGRVRKIRQANFAYLREHWPEQPKVVPLPMEWRASDVPLGFPVIAQERDAFQKALIRRAIFPCIHWKLPDMVRADPRFGASVELSDRIMTIPCDQRYRTADMERVISAVEEVLGTDQHARPSPDCDFHKSSRHVRPSTRH
jgi:dTDP-4-amino-4,6-dideoxygalactose transaminase